jgi:flavin reductase (DIM6/NTAB) family NADH-FMN oxidoreductase RutF
MSKVKMGPRRLLYPMPATLVGANVEGKPNYLTIAWCGIVQSEPPMISVALRKGRYTSPGIKQNGTFSVNIASAEMATVVDWVGTKSGHKVDKSGVFTTFYGDLKTAPMIQEAPINMECRLFKIIDLEGTHELFIGEIIQCYASEECLTDGEPDADKIDPLVYTTGDSEYRRLGEVIAKAFEVGKQYKRK